MTLIDTTPSRKDQIMALAVAGLRLEAHPVPGTEDSVSARLFEVRTAIATKLKALNLLRRTYDTTDPDALCAQDAKIFVSEIQRRQRQLFDLRRERDTLLVHYGEELLCSTKLHPDLHELAGEISPEDA